MKIFILIVLFFVVSKVFGQVDSTGNPSISTKDKFYGLIQNSNQNFLINRKGAVYLDKQDAFQTYYRQIYSDSTIINPNFVAPVEDFNNLPIIFFDLSKFGLGNYLPIKLNR